MTRRPQEPIYTDYFSEFVRLEAFQSVVPYTSGSLEDLERIVRVVVDDNKASFLVSHENRQCRKIRRPQELIYIPCLENTAGDSGDST